MGTFRQILIRRSAPNRDRTESLPGFASHGNFVRRGQVRTAGRVILDQRGVRALNPGKDHNLNCHRLNWGTNDRPPTATNQLRSGEHGLSESITNTPRAQHSTATTCRCASRVEGRSARKGHSQTQMPSNWKETNICNIGRFGCNSRQRLFSPLGVPSTY